MSLDQNNNINNDNQVDDPICKGHLNSLTKGHVGFSYIIPKNEQMVSLKVGQP